MKNEPAIAIIVLNWNGFQDTCECLNALNKTNYNNYKIVLVDNGSEENEGARLKELFPHVHLISNKTNRGFAGGNNDGIRWALNNGFEYIVNLNNDCIVEKSWLKKLWEGIKSVNADFGSSRIMYYPETQLICSDGDGLLPDGEGIILNHQKSFAGSNQPTPIFSACGAASIYSAECLEATKVAENQFFDELYFAYFEDIDLGNRLSARACKGVCVHDAVVYHKGGQTAGGRSYLKIFNLEKNRILNEILNYPLWLIPFGEMYYFLKTLCQITKKIGGRFRGKKAESQEAEKKFSAISVFWASRKWIIANFFTIWNNRRCRKARGLINGKIYKHFHWKFF